MTTTISSSLGNGLAMAQAGSYDAIDARRLLDGVASEGILSAGSYAVTQRGAGANMTVDIAASTGDGARILGDSVTAQGLYRIAPAASVINEAITAAHATLPRNDLIVAELKDHAHDASGSTLAQVRVIAGTATAGAAKTDALGVNGTPALPSSAIALAVVNVPATDTSITDSQIDDRRGFVWRGGSGGKSIIATEESRTNTAYGLLATPDRVRVVLPTDGLLFVAFQGMWREGVLNAARAGIFLDSNQIKAADGQLAAPDTAAGEASIGGAGANVYKPLGSIPVGLYGYQLASAAYTGDVTTGQVVGITHDGEDGAGVCAIFAAAGTYDVSIQFKASSGSVTAKNRKLWVWTMAFG